MNSTQVFEKCKIAVAIGIDLAKDHCDVVAYNDITPTTRSASPKPICPTRSLGRRYKPQLGKTGWEVCGHAGFRIPNPCAERSSVVSRSVGPLLLLLK